MDYGTTSYVSNASDAETSAIIAGLTVFYVIVAIAAYIFTAIFLSKIFKKAAIPSWIAWVPIYNTWKILEIGGQKGFWAPLLLVPIVNYVSIVFLVIAQYNIGLKLGKSGAFVVLGIFLPVVWYVWLAVDKSVWNDSLGAPSLAVDHLNGAAPTAVSAQPAPAQAPQQPTPPTPPTTPLV